MASYYKITENKNLDFQLYQENVLNNDNVEMNNKNNGLGCKSPKSDSSQNLIDDTNEKCDGTNSCESSNEISEVMHMDKLGKVCRICGKMTVAFTGPKKGSHKTELIKHVKKIWGIDITDEDSDVYPVNICLYCSKKIKMWYQKILKRIKCDAAQKVLADFSPHTDENCSICLLKEKQEVLSFSSEIKNREEKVTEANNFESRPKRNAAKKRSSDVLSNDVSIQTEYITDINDIESNILNDFLLDKQNLGHSSYNKQNIEKVNNKYLKNGRLRPLITCVNKFCNIQKENKIDVLFFMLIEALKEFGDKNRSELVENVWDHKKILTTSLNEEECLAKRVMLKQTKDQYRKDYYYFKEKLEKPVLKPLSLINKLEKTYYPEHVEYFVTDFKGETILKQHLRSLNISLSNISTKKYIPTSPVGVQWNYFDVVSKTLEEVLHTLQINKDLGILEENDALHVTLCDYKEDKRDNMACSGKASNGNNISYHKITSYYFAINSIFKVNEKENSKSEISINKNHIDSIMMISKTSYLRK